MEMLLAVLPLNPDPLDLIERDLVAGTIVELGGSWAFMRGHELCIFERAACVSSCSI